MRAQGRGRTVLNTVNGYALLDCGDGERLERFGPYCVRRPAPAADFPKTLPEAAWKAADLVFLRRDGTKDGAWSSRHGAVPESWLAEVGPLRLELRPSAIGHVGVFPEQLCNWTWLADICLGADRPLRVLNAFAYTGASTLACLGAAGAHPVEVVHLDGSKSAVAWARANAAHMGLADRPVRWIVDDTLTFLEREIRRRQTYDVLVLDPPAFGRGPGGTMWKWERDLSLLLTRLGELVSDRPCAVLFTAHAPEYGPAPLEALLSRAFPGSSAESAPMTISPEHGGRTLPAGYLARLRFDR